MLLSLCFSVHARLPRSLDVGLLELPLVPSRLDLVALDSPDLSGFRDIAADSARDDVDSLSDEGSDLVEMPDLVDRDFEHGQPGVRGLASVYAVALVAEPCLRGWSIDSLDELGIGGSPGSQRRFSASNVAQARGRASKTRSRRG